MNRYQQTTTTGRMEVITEANGTHTAQFSNLTTGAMYTSPGWASYDSALRKAQELRRNHQDERPVRPVNLAATPLNAPIW
jgi:hypothetical protein